MSKLSEYILIPVVLLSIGIFVIVFKGVMASEERKHKVFIQKALESKNMEPCPENKVYIGKVFEKWSGLSGEEKTSLWVYTRNTVRAMKCPSVPKNI